jgi:hypothetical protein
MSDPLSRINHSPEVANLPIRPEEATWMRGGEAAPVLIFPLAIAFAGAVATIVGRVAAITTTNVRGAHNPALEDVDSDRMSAA